MPRRPARITAHCAAGCPRPGRSPSSLGGRMGQEITVTARRGAAPSIMLFDCNRSITGMAIERYSSLADTEGSRPPDVLARRLFDLGATRVTVYSSDVTVEAPEERWAELEPQV